MKQNSRTHFSSFFDLKILLLLLVSEKVFSYNIGVDPFFLSCSGDPKSCDDSDTNGQVVIKYPFYIKNLQQPFCGYPGFEVYCNGNRRPVLQLPGNDDYIIHSITYEKRTFRVSNIAFSDQTLALCDAPIRNLTLSGDRYELGPDTANTTVLFNCSSSKLSENLLQYRIGDCEKGLVLGLSGNDSDSVNEVSKECGDLVLAPVKDIGGSETVAMRLRGGFLLKWTASDCSVCETSGGQCGFDANSYRFQCFCFDRPRAENCFPEEGNLVLSLMIGIGIAAGVVLLMILVFFIWRKCSLNGNSLVFWKKKADKFKNIEIFLREFGSLCPKRFSYSEIKKITNSFKDKLGEGGFGGVYHGKLQDGRPVAVKVLKGSKGNGEDFINEVSSISRTSHINIVTLIGFCFESDKRALVYEFMANGSLEKFIYEKGSGNADRQLKWETLYQIAVGIGRGLEYLHRGCNTRILHFDIKPHNILLDDDFSPKICDFGLAKICPRKESIVSMLGARGTAGYIAPEVFSRNFGGVSHKSDVYSYGMMVFEMVGGRRNIDVGVGNTSEIYFPHWIYKRLELNEELGLQGIVDEVDIDCARKMILVSLWCIQTDPLARPPMSRVVEMLEGSLSFLQIPPKPFLSSPSRSPADSPTISSSTFVALN